MSYYTNEDLDNWKENAVLYKFKWPSRKEFTDFHNSICHAGEHYFGYNGDPDAKKINWRHLDKLYMRWLNHKEAWRNRKEKEFFAKYPNIELYVLEGK